MRIAVTGGSGRIGSVLIKTLIARGHEVINIDRRQAVEPVAHRFVYAQLGQREQVQPVLETVQAVCHLGEIASTHTGLSPEQVLAENVRVGSTVLQTAADLRLSRIIYTSTCQVYGLWEPPVLTTPQRLPMDETQPVASHNSYALSKVTNESFCRILAQQHGLSIAVFRLPWVIPWEYSDDWLHQLRQPPKSTDGFATYCHVSDVAQAYALALEHPLPGCETYHFTADEIFSLYPLADRLRRHHPQFPALPGDWPDFRSPVLTDKARRHFGWEPNWNALNLIRDRHGPITPLRFE